VEDYNEPSTARELLLPPKSPVDGVPAAPTPPPLRPRCNSSDDDSSSSSEGDGKMPATAEREELLNDDNDSETSSEPDDALLRPLLPLICMSPSQAEIRAVARAHQASWLALNGTPPSSPACNGWGYQS
jgi:hypothetical protein